MSSETENNLITFIVCILLLFVFYGCEVINKSQISVIDKNVTVVDKYHKAEDCDSYNNCDPERFVVLFDNHETFKLDKSNWQLVHEGQLWHFHKETGKLGIDIKKTAYEINTGINRSTS